MGPGNSSETLIDEGAACSIKIPINSNDSLEWKSIEFDDTNWVSGNAGIGYETSGNDYGNLINLDISSLEA